MAVVQKWGNLPDEYIQWNARILDFCVEESASGDGRFTLAVSQLLDEEPDPHAAEESLTAAVRNAYDSLLADDFPLGDATDALSFLAIERDAVGRPLCGAFLALSVLAAEKMMKLEYYRHLAKALGRPACGSGLFGFDHNSFVKCWDSLGRWLRRFDILLDEPPQGEKPFIRWPKMHTLLRRMDLDKLPRFFTERELRPLHRYTPAQIDRELSVWGYSRFTRTGRGALADPIRKPSVLRQIMRELAAWDPSLSPAPSGAAPDGSQILRPLRPIEAWLCWRPWAAGTGLFLRAPRRQGFPAEISNGAGFSWRAVSDDWYEDAPVSSELLAKLSNGFSVGQAARIQFRAASLFVLIPPMGSGSGLDAKANDGIPWETTCAILCSRRLEPAVGAYLSNICDAAPEAKPLSGGVWRLFTGVKAVRECEPSSELEALRVIDRLTVTLHGGLRTGRQRSWLDCAPPTALIISGRKLPRLCKVNGVMIPIVSGRADLIGAFPQAGAYEISVGETEFRIQVEPTVIRTVSDADEELCESRENASPLQARASTPASRPMLLPAGRWVLLGSRPGEIASQADETDGGFVPSWLVGSDPRGAPAVVVLADGPSQSANRGRTYASRERLWAHILLTARPVRFGSASPNHNAHDANEVRRSWSDLVSVARRASARRGALKRFKSEDEDV